MKKTRARTIEEKDKIFKEMIHKGKELFLRYGAGGFTLRALANELDMGQASLYTYFESKRELWFAIVEDEFEHIDQVISEHIMNHKGKNLDLIDEIAQIYFSKIKDDYRNFRFIFKTIPPKSMKKGPFEEKYQIRTINIFQDIFLNAAREGEIKERETIKLAYFFWSMIFGIALSTQTDLFGSIDNLPYFGTLGEYFDFVLKEIKIFINALKEK